MSGNSDDEFDRIVEGLTFDDSFDDPDEVVEQPTEPVAPEPEPDAFTDDGGYLADAEIYQPPSGPVDLGLNFAWYAVFGIPAIFTLATISGIILPRPIAYGSLLLFVAAVVYLFSRIPRDRDEGDDGAVV